MEIPDQAGRGGRRPRQKGEPGPQLPALLSARTVAANAFCGSFQTLKPMPLNLEAPGSLTWEGLAHEDKVCQGKVSKEAQKHATGSSSLTFLPAEISL